MQQKIASTIISIILILWVTIQGAVAQESVSIKPPTRHFAWTPVSKNLQVKGLAFGLSASPWDNYKNKNSFHLKGTNLELGPMGLVTGLWGTMFGIIGSKNEDGTRTSFFSNHGYATIYESEKNY